MPLEDGLNRIRTAMDLGAWGDITQIIEELYPPDQAELMKSLTTKQQQIVLKHLSHELIAHIFAELDYETQRILLPLVAKGKIPLILDEMASDDAADLLGELTQEQAHEYLELMQDEEAEEVRELLVYPEHTSGGLMTTEFVALPQGITAEEAIESLRRLSPDAETVYYVYVTDESGHLAGVLSLRDLIVSNPQTPLTQIMKETVIAVPADMDQEEVARVLSKYDFLALPVVDETNHILGIITVDDVMDVITEETTEDFTKMAGIAGMDDLRISSYEAARRRLPWLVFLLFAGLISGNIISRFEATLQAVVSLAVFIPLIADMAGNTGTQALAVVVRTLALEKVVGPDILKLLRKEAGIGLIIGTVNGILAALMALAWQGSPVLGFVIGVSLWLTMIVATIAGALVPILLHSLKIDPAVASGPFITTVNDVVGLTIYFTMASLFISHL